MRIENLIHSLLIKYILIISFFLSFSLISFAEKVNILVIKTENTGITEWQILDEQCRLIFSGNGFSGKDSVFFSLEAGKRYFFQVSVSFITNRDTTLYSLSINGEPVLLINSDTEPGDHFFPFYTGVKKEPDKIIGGTDANIADFPWQVYYESGKYLCGGTIISENWIVTAAHCARNENGSAIPVSEMFIKAGATNPYKVSEGKKYQISEVIVHENFNNITLNNDIALLRLELPVDVPNARPIKLVTGADVKEGATDPGVISWVTGWGLTDVYPETFPYILQKVQLPIVSREQALTVWRNIPDNVIMAGYRSGSKDACNGDSGGPLVVPVSGEYRLAGITSWGSEDCDTYSAYTRVSSFENWIRTKTGIMEYIPSVPSGDTLICQGEGYDNYTIEPVQGVSEYQWELFPEIAGKITGNGSASTVIWDPEYLGAATVKLRVITNNKISEWSRLNVEVVRNTKIITQPPDRILCAGQTIDLGISAEGHNLKYHWYKDNAMISTLSAGNYTIPNSSTGNSGVYYCILTGSCGTLNTNNINVTVHPLTRINYISPDITASSGEDITLKVLAEGHELTYQWTKNDKLLENGDTYSVELPDANASDIGLYQATVRGTCGTEMSSKSYVYIRKDKTSVDPEIFVWPTVTNSEINVALSTNEFYDVRIYSYTGRILEDLKDCSYQTVIYMGNYPRGIYIIHVSNRNFRWSQKFLKN